MQKELYITPLHFYSHPWSEHHQRAISAANQIIEALGAKAKVLDAIEHDRILAATSHLPFLLASALALTTPDNFASFVGTGFKSTSRVAGTSSSMMLGVLQSNRENVLNVLHGLQNELANIESALSSEDFEKLEISFERSANQTSDPHPMTISSLKIRTYHTSIERNCPRAWFQVTDQPCFVDCRPRQWNHASNQCALLRRLTLLCQSTANSWL